jgi:hypothetical protein
MRPNENDNMPKRLDRIVSRLKDTLGEDGWRIRESRRGARAYWRWLSVTIKNKADKNPEQPWRVRLRNGFPRSTVAEHWSSDPVDALDKVVKHAREVRRFVEKGSGLARNPSKSWLAHRLWEATRPQ